MCLHPFYVTQYQMKRLVDALNLTLTSSLISKRNMKKFSFLPKLSPVQECRPLQAKFYKTSKNFQNPRGMNSATMHVKNSGWSMFKFQDLPNKRNPRPIQDNFLFSCSKEVRLSSNTIIFVNLKRMKTIENAAKTNCFTI